MEKYADFKKNHFPIFKGIISGYIRKDNIHIFITMLREKNKIVGGTKTMDECNETLREVLGTACNFDPRLLTEKYYNKNK